MHYMIAVSLEMSDEPYKLGLGVPAVYRRHDVAPHQALPLFVRSNSAICIHSCKLTKILRKQGIDGFLFS